MSDTKQLEKELAELKKDLEEFTGIKSYPRTMEECHRELDLLRANLQEARAKLEGYAGGYNGALADLDTARAEIKTLRNFSVNSDDQVQRAISQFKVQLIMAITNMELKKAGR